MPGNPEPNGSEGLHLAAAQHDERARLTLPLDAPAAGTYELIGFFTRVRDYGIARILVNGRAVGPLVDGYAP